MPVSRRPRAAGVVRVEMVIKHTAAQGCAKYLHLWPTVHLIYFNFHLYTIAIVIVMYSMIDQHKVNRGSLWSDP